MSKMPKLYYGVRQYYVLIRVTALAKVTEVAYGYSVWNTLDSRGTNRVLRSKL